jgi:hypothetical protein
MVAHTGTGIEPLADLAHRHLPVNEPTGRSVSFREVPAPVGSDVAEPPDTHSLWSVPHRTHSARTAQRGKK